MVADRTLYDLLEVEPDATQEQIIKAARKKSLEHHPDRGGSHEMMQKINAAREVLTDPEKRTMYDRYGLKGLKSNIENGEFAFNDIPPNIFDIFDLFGYGRPAQAAVQKGRDIKQALKVSLEELYSGTTRAVSIERDIVCTECNGTGCHDGVPRECGHCRGTGVEVVIRRMGPLIQQIQAQCSTCKGDGYVIESKNVCRSCTGHKLKKQKKKIDVDIPQGSQHREAIKYISEGNQIVRGEAGSLYVIIEQLPHTTFVRRGDHLMMNIEINLTDSLCGFQQPITLLNGHKILINHPPGSPIAPNSYRRLKGYGMPNRQTHIFGDLIVHFDVKFPPENFIKNETQLKQLEAALPPKLKPRIKNKEIYKEVPMTPCDPVEEDARHHHHEYSNHYAGYMDEPMDDHVFEEPQGIRCRTS